MQSRGEGREAPPETLQQQQLEVLLSLSLTFETAGQYRFCLTIA